MEKKRRSWPVRLISWCYELLNSTRRLVLNLIFLVILIIVVAAVLAPKGPPIENGTALLLAPHGLIVEQAEVQNPLAKLMQSFGDEEPPQTELRFLLAAIKHAKTDDRITHMVIDTSDLMPNGFTHLAELKDAIIDFKTSGKKVIARGEWFAQSHYYLAAQADEIYLDPMGVVEIDGFAKVRTYFKSALDKLGVQVHVFKVGTHKSAVEPYIRDNMSDEDKSGTLKWMGALWEGYKTDVATARKLEPSVLQTYADDAANQLTASNGDTAQMALNAKLVDGLKTRIEYSEYLTEMIGENHEGDDFKHIDAVAYAHELENGLLPSHTDAVGVIVAEGEIIDGHSVDGMLGGDTLAEQIRDAREDDSIKALVLRVNSPGGSAFASEVIRRELAALQAAGKPLVVSMSSVAASGGYWIAAGADEIFAHPYTITGSIGIYGMVPTVDALINEHGIHRDGVGTTKLAGGFDIGRPLSPEIGSLIQQSINNGYERFLSLVGEARKKSRAEVDAIAQGQVWDGSYALSIGLIDKLGTLDAAVKAAATRAELGSDYRIDYIERELTPGEQMAMAFASKVSAVLPAPSASALNSPLMWEAKAAVREAKALGRFNDPRSMYLHCMCVLQ